LLVIEVGNFPDSFAFTALEVFADPATGAPLLACATRQYNNDYGHVRVFDPVAGGETLVVIDVGSSVNALAFFTDPAMGELRLACGCWDGKVRIFDPVAGGEALVVIEVKERTIGGSEVEALAVFTDPATGALRLACGCRGEVHIYDPVAGGETLVVLKGHTNGVSVLTVFEDPATGDLRLASGSWDGSVRVWDLASGGAALFVLDVGATKLAVFTDPATGETRLASGHGETVRAWDLSKGGAALRVVAFDAGVSALAVTSDKSRLFVASGKGWGEFRTGSS